MDPEDILSAFADGEMVQLWAKEKVATAIHNGLVLGFNGELRPLLLPSPERKQLL
ncbi:hypothetical protein J27TS8_32750 [Robertmurraya siralis]|uniref:Uncharacterized protein n=1 Tax=Robertmurraya siralis TaxID=77777 RepID=A0A919WKD5_9BACI|nr:MULTISPECIES: hypothetical protein [Robertmurraya]MDF1510285.1 hypothetical protein [Robertmurraya sp. DFI.2.37]GIN63282.1 hypothetical protein J27TS8_32750 [Robertmurraya siralis]